MTIAHALMATLSGAPPAPTFLSAGTGGSEAPVSGTLQVPYPATVAANNFLLLHVVAKDSGGPAITTPSGWTSFSARVSSDTLLSSALYWKLAAGTETGNLDVTVTADTVAAGRIYRFSSGSGVEAAGSAVTDASGTGMSAVNVTTLGSDRLAIQCFFAKVNTTIGNISGETNADYTEAVAEYASATGPVIFSCQAAAVASATAITGGSATLASAGTYRVRHGFAIKP